MFPGKCKNIILKMNCGCFWNSNVFIDSDKNIMCHLYFSIVCQMHLTDYLITLVSVRVCVCPPIGCRTITPAILYRFSPIFACRSEMWLFRTLLFLEQTRSSLPILEMCKVQFWQFRDCGGHILPRIVTKNRIEI